MDAHGVPKEHQRHGAHLGSTAYLGPSLLHGLHPGGQVLEDLNPLDL